MNFPNLADWSPSCFKGDSPPRRDLIEGRLPRGKLVLLAGEGGVGKSMLLLDLFEAVTRGGTDAFGGRVIGGPQPCLLLTGEDDKASIDLRLKIIRNGVSGADFGAILPIPDVGVMPLFKMDYMGAVEQTEWLLWLEEQITAMREVHGPVGFLAIDPLAQFFPVDANRADHVQPIWGRLGEIANRLDCTIIVAHHLGKGNGDTRTRVRGSTALVDGVRAAYGLEQLGTDDAVKVRAELDIDEPLDVVRLVLLKNNLGLRRTPVTFVRLPDGRLQDVSEMLQPAMGQDEALLFVIRKANSLGERMTKTGEQGVYKAKSTKDWWPRELNGLTKAGATKQVNALLTRGLVKVHDGALVAPE